MPRVPHMPKAGLARHSGPFFSPTPYDRCDARATTRLSMQGVASKLNLTLASWSHPPNDLLQGTTVFMPQYFEASHVDRGFGEFGSASSKPRIGIASTANRALKNFEN